MPKKHLNSKPEEGPTPKKRKRKQTHTTHEKTQNERTSKRNNNRTRKKKNDDQNHQVRVLYSNPNGITGKTESLKAIAYTLECDFVLLAETKLKGPPPTIEGYKWITKNRTARAGGGTAILIKEEHQKHTKRLINTETIEQELIWIEYKPPSYQPLYIGIFYGPQEKENKEETEAQYAQIITEIEQLKQKGKIILTGDFNAKLSIGTTKITQEQTRNGKYLQDLIDQTNMKPISITEITPTWTRENRKNSEEKSIIDYILVSKNVVNQIKELKIDNIGTWRLKGKEETDHNTITFEIHNQKEKQRNKKTKRKRWILNNKEAWENFNNHIKNEYQKNGANDYDTYKKWINEGMEKHIPKVTIKEHGKKKESPKTKKLREEMRTKRKELQAIDNNEKSKKKEAIDLYIDAQKKLRDSIAEDEKINLQQKIKKIATESKKYPETIWKIAKKMKRNLAEEKEITITEEGEKITNPDEAKVHIAAYYENLYRAREGEPGTEESTQEIIDQVQSWNNETNGEEPPITENELQKVKKSLKRKKACGPDEIPNEILIEADPETLKIHMEMINLIYEEEKIPNDWLKGSIKRLYKGKGVKGKCSNERGITLASNIGKIFERIINNRISGKINMTDHQAGGKKGRATADHIMILQNTINQAKKNNKKAMITFLDVTKAYDKAWLDAIMYTMGHNGVNGKNWKIIKKLNENLTATLQTNHGPTREIKIKDSIRQGGVLSVNQYALLMDEISKAILEKNLGVPDLNGNKTGCLLWMDDVALISNNEEEMDEMLNITNDIARKYHIKFGQEKSKIMMTGKINKKHIFHLGEMTIERTKSYKYLGITLNEKNSLKEHIKNVKSKCEAAYQTIMAICGDSELKGIQMRAAWTLINACIEPIIMYGLESTSPTKNEITELNRIWTNIIKRILMTPQSTPNEAIYMETGTLDVETMLDRNKIRMICRLRENTNPLLTRVLEDNTPDGWNHNTTNLLQKFNITEEDLSLKKGKRTKIIDKKIMTSFKNKVEEQSKEKSKIQTLLQNSKWEPKKRKVYMNRLNRNETSIIFKARTRMARTKMDYKNMHRDHICRKCKKEEETLKHVLQECQTIHTDEKSKVKWERIYSNNINELKDIAGKIKKIITEINNV